MKNLVSISLIFLISLARVYCQNGFIQEGLATVYVDGYEGKSTASGEKYSFRKATCAHLNLPFGTLVKITNLDNNISVVLRVNDRGPFVPDRVVMVSKSAAEKLAFKNLDGTKARVEVVEENGKPVVMPIPLINSNKNQIAVKEKNDADTSKSKASRQNELSSDFYKIDISNFTPNGFTLQLGSYKELSNLIKIANDAKTNLKKDIFLQVINTSSEKLYKLYYGQFSTKADAEKQKDMISKYYPGCFIVELNK